MPRNESGDFRLADWWVRPQLNRLELAGDHVHVEPKVMDLLVFLAGRPKEVISKDEIIETVWEGQFISDSALTRTVADLRRALGDDVRSPRFIATISKRGYRLVAAVTSEPAASSGDDARPARVLAVGGAFALTWEDRTVALAEGEHFIGRAPEGLVSIASRKVSRRHARIVVTSRAAKLEDLGSKNGTYLNDRRIEGGVELAHGDAIQVGPAKLIFKAFVADGSTETEFSRLR